MNPSVKLLWVTALESGEYERTMGDLRKGDCFCALGVLCDLYSKEYKIPWTPLNDYGTYSILNHTGLLPPPVMKWAGLDSPDPYVRVTRVERAVSSWNDAQYEWAIIADAIRRDL